MKNNRNNHDQHGEQELTTRNKKPIKSIRGFREHLEDQETLAEIEEFKYGGYGLETSLGDLAADDIG